MNAREGYGPFDYGVWAGAEPPLPRPSQISSPQAVERHREAAVAFAQRAPANFVGVALYPSGSWGHGWTPPRWDTVGFPSKEALENWYAKIAYAKPSNYSYVAVFDKSGYGAQPYGQSYYSTKKQSCLVPILIGAMAIGGALWVSSLSK